MLEEQLASLIFIVEVWFSWSFDGKTPFYPSDLLYLRLFPTYVIHNRFLFFNYFLSFFNLVSNHKIGRDHKRQDYSFVVSNRSSSVRVIIVSMGWLIYLLNKGSKLKGFIDTKG